MQFTRDVVPLRPRVATIFFGWNDHWDALGTEDKRVAELSIAPALEELYNFGPHLGNLAFEIGNPNLPAGGYATAFELEPGLLSLSFHWLRTGIEAGHDASSFGSVDDFSSLMEDDDSDAPDASLEAGSNPLSAPGGDKMSRTGIAAN